MSTATPADSLPQEPHHPGRRWPLLASSSVLVAIDFMLGPVFALPAFYVLPVIWAAWSIGLRFACALACALCLFRFTSHWIYGFPFDFSAAFVNNLFRSATFIAVACLTAHVAQKLRSQRARIAHLERNLPVCTSCSLIRDTDGRWLPVENFGSAARPREHLCPDCERRRYGFTNLE